MNATPTFAALLRAYRRTARLTVQDLAAASGVSVRAIGDMERGHSTAPQRRTLDAIADALALDPPRRAALTGAARAARSRPGTAYTLPRDVSDFTGRAAELDVLASSPRLLIHGLPGVGKTALAVRAAARFPGRVWFLDGARSGPLPADPDGLLIIDDITSADQVPPPGGGTVWLTSRRTLPALDIPRLHLGPLPPPDAAALLATITGTPPDEAAERVASYCGHLPLALRIAGNRVAGRPGWTMSHLAARLSDESRRLPTLTAGDLSVERVFAAACAGLSAEAMSALAGGTDRAGLAELATHSLATARDEVHPLLSLFARTQEARSVARVAASRPGSVRQSNNDRREGDPAGRGRVHHARPLGQGRDACR